MTPFPHAPATRRAGPPAASAALVALLSAGVLVAGAGPAQAVATPAPLGTAGSFAVLAGSGITNTGPTTLRGDLGTFPTTTVTGAGSITIVGVDHGGDAVTQQAQQDLRVAYDAAAGQSSDAAIAADLGGLRLTPGVYSSASSIGLTGELVLDGAGDAAAVFVFQAGSSLTTATASSVRLVGGAQACNVFWQVGSSATLGTASTFRGTLMALTSITVSTGATVEGRVLARNGAVTLDTDTVTRPSCASAVTPSPTTTPTSPPPTPTTAVPAATPSARPTPGPVTPTPSRRTAAPPGGSTRQVTRVPTGGVGTGDGTTAEAEGGLRDATATSVVLALTAVAVAAAVGTISARRRRSRA